MTENIAPVRVHCNSCARETRHEVISSRRVDMIIDEEIGYIIAEAFDVLQCLGCETVLLRRTQTDPTMDGADVAFYPPRVSRRLPEWLFHMPAELRGLLEEIYAALQADSRRLALMGVRTLIDLLVVTEIGDVGTFAAKLQALEHRGLIASRGREVLAAAVDAGSAAAHRGYQPNVGQLNAVIDIVENVLQATYHLPRVAEHLRRTTPSRPPHD